MGRLRRYLLVTVSAAALSTSAMAADIPARMPVKAPPPVVAPWSWAGFYIGLHAGAVWNHAAFTDLGDETVPPVANRAPLGVEFWKPHKAGSLAAARLGTTSSQATSSTVSKLTLAGSATRSAPS
jgi:opacity protein-like surface antigen